MSVFSMFGFSLNTATLKLVIAKVFDFEIIPDFILGNSTILIPVDHVEELVQLEVGHGAVDAAQVEHLEEEISDLGFVNITVAPVEFGPESVNVLHDCIMVECHLFETAGGSFRDLSIHQINGESKPTIRVLSASSIGAPAILPQLNPCNDPEYQGNPINGQI